MNNRQGVVKTSPKDIFSEWERGRSYKESLGELGMTEQNRRNERFFVGDQWHGAKCGGERPLVRHNVIKRIGDYKMAMVGASPLAVTYHAQGLPYTVPSRERVAAVREQIADRPSEAAALIGTLAEEERANLVMSAMNDYFAATAERVRLDMLKVQVLRRAYISGTAYMHLYWDPGVQTGLYADASRRVPVRGDVAAEVLDVEHVFMGDPVNTDLQSQPYILIEQRKPPAEIEAMRNVYAPSDEPIRADGEGGWPRAAAEPEKATLITKMWKEYDAEGQCRVMAVQVCRGVTVRPPWDLGVRLYPLAGFAWETRKDCAYGDSEVTYLIPNQIAINRMITASVWAVMMMGIPITVVNGDVVQGPVTNDPGQVIRVFGNAEDVAGCVRYVNPPQFSPKFDDNISSLIRNTLTQSGANDAALGDVRPDNTSAIIAVREAAALPLQTVQNRFYGFVEEVARILADFWVTHYGDRPLQVADERGVWYMPFHAEECRSLIITAKIDVGAAGLWSESQAIRTLDNLLQSQVITPKQYLERLPKGFVPEIGKLIRELSAMSATDEETASIGQALPDAYRARWDALSAQEQEQLLTQALNPA